jgi:Transposase DNA-binding/Transposase Tn5 dimerisation domain
MENEERNSEYWIRYELSAISLGDKRLDWRLLDSASKLASRPSMSISQACDDWADTKATYRLFANEKTTAAKILSPHQERTSERMTGQTRSLAIQDTTLLDYSHHPSKTGLGPIGTSAQKTQGLVMHSVLATSLQGLPLGILSQQIWSREATPNEMSPSERRKLPIEAKESYKWLVALRESVAHKPAHTQLITVGDSEADIYELFHYARELKTDLLIRAGQERTVCEPEVGLLWPLLEKQPIAGHLQVHVAERKAQPARDAIVAVRYLSLTLRPPQHLRARLGPIPLYGILVQEVDPPPDVEPLCWLLLTTVPVGAFDAAVECIEWYCQRWQIEILHKILKSGCRIEAAQLASSQRLLPMIALFTIIAWRLFWLTWFARTNPEAPATSILATHELQALYTFLHKQPLPDALQPTVHQAVRWLARLGGFLARKHDGEPGVTVFWRGWQRLSDISATYLAFHPPPTCG